MSTTTTRLPWARAATRAAKVVAMLEPGTTCHKLEIAGSIRRRERTVGDVEIVCVPRVERVTREVGPLGLFGQDTETLTVSRLWTHLDALVERGSCSRGRLWGAKYRQILTWGVAVDIFTAKPEGYGLQKLIRTGPVDFSRAYVTALHRFGLQSVDGLVLRKGTGQVVPCTTEAEAFALVGWPDVPPVNRKHWSPPR